MFQCQGLLSLSQHHLAPFRPQPHHPPQPIIWAPTPPHCPHTAVTSRPLSLPAGLPPARTQGAAGSHLCLSVYKSAPARCLFTSGAGHRSRLGPGPHGGHGARQAGGRVAPAGALHTRGGPRAREAAGAQFVARGRWQESIRALAGRGPGQQGCGSPGEPAARTGAQNHAAGASRFPSPAACSALSVRRAEGGLARARQTELTDVPGLKGLQIHAGSGARGRRVEE